MTGAARDGGATRDEWGTVLVIAKRPVPGRVKTRLTPPFTPTQAAGLAAAALRDTLRAAAAVPAAQHVLLFDGDPTGWLPSGWRLVPQVSGGLDVRLTAGFVAVAGAGPAVLVGMDTPQLRADLLPPLPPGVDACFGPASDGGFWALGLRDPAQAVDTIPGVPMSAADTGSVQRERLCAAGLVVVDLPELTDVDDEATARAVAAVAPGSEFAARLAAG